MEASVAQPRALSEVCPQTPGAHLTLYSPLPWSGGKRARDHGDRDRILAKWIHSIHSGPLKEATPAPVLPEPTQGVSHHSTQQALPV